MDYKTINISRFLWLSSKITILIHSVNRLSWIQSSTKAIRDGLSQESLTRAVNLHKKTINEWLLMNFHTNLLKTFRWLQAWPSYQANRMSWKLKNRPWDPPIAVAALILNLGSTQRRLDNDLSRFNLISLRLSNCYKESLTSRTKFKNEIGRLPV